MRSLITALLSSAGLLAAHAEDLTTRDGTVYRNYRIVSSDPGYVTILYNDGGGRIPLVQLPIDLQHQYHYNPAKAAAYTRQFEAEDHHERVAVQLAQSNSLGDAASGMDASGFSASAPSSAPTNVQPVSVRAPEAEPASAPVLASSSGDAAGSSRAFDPGDDPLAPDADVLSQNSPGDSGNAQGSDFSYYAAYDNSGGLWVSSYDLRGRIRWYRWDRKGGDRRGGWVRLDGCRDLPPNALVTLDRSGQWVITYVDGHGMAQRFYRKASDLHADPGAGAWRVVVDRDGSRSLRHEGEAQSPPQDFHHYAFADRGSTHDNLAPMFRGYASSAHPGTSFSGSIVTGENLHPGMLSGQTGTGMGLGRSFNSGGAAYGTSSTVVHVTPTPAPATAIRTH